MSAFGKELKVTFSDRPNLFHPRRQLAQRESVSFGEALNLNRRALCGNALTFAQTAIAFGIWTRPPPKMERKASAYKFQLSRVRPTVNLSIQWIQHLVLELPSPNPAREYSPNFSNTMKMAQLARTSTLKVLILMYLFLYFIKCKF